MAGGLASSAGKLERLIFKRRDLLRFSGLGRGARQSLPFFLHHEDGLPMFTQRDGTHVPFSVDSEYEALDHCLLWLDFTVSFDDVSTNGALASAAIYGYLGGGDQAALEVWAGRRSEVVELAGMPQPARKVLLAADHFEEADYAASGAPPGWDMYVGPEDAVKLVPIHALQLGQRFHEPLSSAVQLDASLADLPLPLQGRDARMPLKGQGAGVMLRRPVKGLWATPQSRLHLRARFQDCMAEGAPQSHWIGLASNMGTCAVGLAPRFADHYASVNGHWHADRVPQVMHTKWQKSGVKRSPGWHTFEVVLELRHVCIMVDGEPVSIGQASCASREDSITLASECGGCGVWTAIELLHTPLGRGTWEAGLQEVEPRSAKPWEIIAHEEGYWSVTGLGPVEEVPAEEVAGPRDEDGPPEVQAEEEEEEEAAPAEAVPQAQAKRRSARRPRSKRSQRSKRPAAPAGLAIECWSMPDETDLARLDRVIGVILERLREANVVVPANFGHIGECEEPQHEKCYVFSFGTRRLHINMREGAGGRVTLAVRVGGGYMDLVEFISKNGSIEQLRLQQAQGAGGEAHHARFCSVLSRGRRQLKDMV